MDYVKTLAFRLYYSIYELSLVFETFTLHGEDIVVKIMQFSPRVVTVMTKLAIKRSKGDHKYDKLCYIYGLFYYVLLLSSL